VRAAPPFQSHTFLRVSLPLCGISFLNQAVRTVTAVIGPEIATEFGLSASDLGLLAAVMFAAYACAQIPVGVALDRYGAGVVQAVLGVTIAVGSALFAVADGFAGLVVGRVVTGVGIAAALMALMTANAQWYPRDRVAAVNGACVCLGALGALAATWPVSLALRVTDWRGVTWGVVGLALAVAAWVWASVPARPPGIEPRRTTLSAEIATVLGIYRSPIFWRFVPAVAMLSAMNFTWLGLWAGPWLRDVAGLGTEARAGVLFAYAAGLASGSLLVGWAVSRFTRAGVDGMKVVTGTMFGLMAVQALLMLRPAAGLSVLWAAFAFLAAAGSVGYTVIAQQFPLSVTGRVSTAINAYMLATVFLMQTAIGRVLDFWPRTATGGWAPQGYTAALGLTLALQAAMTAWMLWPRAPHSVPRDHPV
jgi:predicted MFS family arabinose efflux permease